MHPIRRNIFRVVSERPGNYFFDIANALELPQGTAFWHLKKLEEAGLVKSLRFAGKRIYYSAGLRGETVEKAFVVLKSSATQAVFQYIVNNEGCYQAKIADALKNHHDTIRHHINRLEEAGLIMSYREGRNVYYKLDQLGKDIITSNTEMISRSFIEHLFNVLTDECLYPDIVEKSPNSVTIRISCVGMDDVYFSLELKGWEFVNDFDPDGLPDDMIEDDEVQKPKVSSVEPSLSKPKVERLDT
jgi:DNA-binding transcriptional ArsR family regulator